MAWPLSRLRTYVGASTPTIRADDLNSYSDAIIAIHAGTNTLKSVTLDGTGGAVVAPRAGVLKVSAADTNNATPTQTIAAGEASKGGVPIGWIYGTTAGAILRGYNIFSVAHPMAGTYEVTLNNAPASVNTLRVVTVGGSAGVGISTAANVAGKHVVTVNTYNMAGVLTDYDFHLLVFGE